MEKGMFYSIDALLATTILVVAIFVVGERAWDFAVKEKAETIGHEKELFAAGIAEALVKNRNENKPELGSAYFDKEKQRVMQNFVDEELLKKVKGKSFGRYFLSGIYERGLTGKKNYFESNFSNCLSIERFVIIKGLTQRKAVLGVTVCEE